VVKSVQYGVRHDSVCSVESVPLALGLRGEIQGRIGRPGPKEEWVGLDCNAGAKTVKLFEDAPRSRE
jgi:hypothetical protein